MAFLKRDSSIDFSTTVTVSINHRTSHRIHFSQRITHQTQCSSNSYASMSRYVSPWNLTAVGTCPEVGGGKGVAGCTMSKTS